MTNPTNSQMPDDPGAPENTDEQYVSPDQAETLAEEAAESAALDADEDPLGDITDAEIEDALASEANPDADGDGVVSETELKLAERTEDLQRVSAEYANYRRRTERERGQIAEQAKARVLTDLLPLLDDLDLAEQHGDLNEGPLKVFADKFRASLEGHKVVAFGEEGEDFDPEIHEAVQDLSEEDSKVLGTVLRKGYRVGDRLVRNAMVIITDPAGA
ncbi:nucleotide exchange factor GrpE [Corynebacterium sanguinis]|uniref:Protein GrpE n=1 Tax=Corynebacterium sanguinis TaxID=2594913 RepID=A0A6C1TVU3_9CORY|nr:nucleotide exchange factor GrpE [Corynebacterium sanguinis]MCT1411604.1 nucleotide exchange factor GrpE [Corynebacterium sanguinis]MCT1694932.1 nucleotide exchange factor GrpE [Corynebacterium sanguinis]MCT1714267.1 nucleotide exchange factor GrpE [Corynebacterium sanguinis]MCT2251110.1 nucleotide exchange factor GrpE [Corynebacterium sanguinis]MCT2287654.1 nucleotide exchange factor GrpE [Corynebacterium sanguinis]